MNELEDREIFVNEAEVAAYINDNSAANARAAIYIKNRRATDFMYKLKGNLRNRFNQARKRNSKIGSGVRDLGCSVEFLTNYLQSKFTEGMTQENYGLWHVDHIIPLSSAETPEEALKLCHYSNLQPLWAADNLAKSDKCFNYYIKTHPQTNSIINNETNLKRKQK